MKLHEKTLANGLTLQAVEMPGTNVVTTLILVGAGSRYETKDIAGISHFLEHMFFKGAKKYKTPKEVSEAVDSFGGEFNAFTGKEYAGYYVKSGKENLEKSVDVLSDMLLHSRFPKEEIEKERGVILEEMAMYMDAPMYQITWDFEQLVFGDQPLGRDQIGTRELIKTVTQEQFKEYQDSLYVPSNTVITIAGAVSAKDLQILEKAFLFQEKTPTRTLGKLENLATPTCSFRTKKTEQFHLSFGVQSVAENDPRYAASKVLATVLGGNMSSRMFQNVREEKGLCYSIRTYIEEFTDTGLLTTRAGVKLDDVLKAIEAIAYEYEQIRDNGISADELQKAKNYMVGKTDLATEDTEDVAHHYAKNTLLYKIKESFEDWKTQIGKVTEAEVNTLARELLQPQHFRLAGIGPEIDEDQVREILAR